MDTHISSWILEFILRQQLDDWITCRFISVLPPSDSNLRLKKTILLRRISSLLPNFSFSESILKTLEIIEEIDHCSGTKSPSSMKKAYSSVAVECAAMFLRQEPEDYGSFADTVNRVWKVRIGAMRRWRGGVGFVSDELRYLEREMLAAVENPLVRRKLRERDTRKDALESLKAFLEEAVEEMGLPFLELAAKTLYGKEGAMENWKHGRASKRRLTGLSQHDVNDAERGDFEGAKKKSKFSSKDMRKGSLIPSEKDASDGATVSKKDQRIATLEEVGHERLQNKYHNLPSSDAEVANVQEALRSSSADLHAVVRDPLPDALEFAAGILCNMGPKDQKQPENNQSRLDADGHNSKGIDNGCVRETGSGKENNGKRDGTSWPGFMERNRTAHTYEWDDDSIDSPPEESPNVARKLRLPTPEKRMVSPLKKYETTRFTRRRQIKRWSPEEEQTLREAVQKYGKGNWKAILERYPAIFEERTTIDLKDKWRNMVRG